MSLAFAECLELAQRQRLGFKHHALVNGVGPEDLVEVLRRHGLDREGKFGELAELQTRRSVLGHAQANDLARRVVECRANGMQAIEQHLFGCEHGRLPVARLLAPAILLWRRNFSALALGVAVGASESGVMGVLGALVARIIFAHACLIERFAWPGNGIR